mmetsp:Transcript_7229/g.22263  ORF Transcript_7229/g.22263 Transcript_7229/m.22263 type:complete len:229 (-) Transcript_7229:364-1050(-)
MRSQTGAFGLRLFEELVVHDGVELEEISAASAFSVRGIPVVRDVVARQQQNRRRAPRAAVRAGGSRTGRLASDAVDRLKRDAVDGAAREDHRRTGAPLVGLDGATLPLLLDFRSVREREREQPVELAEFQLQERRQRAQQPGPVFVQARVVHDRDDFPALVLYSDLARLRVVLEHRIRSLRVRVRLQHALAPFCDVMPFSRGVLFVQFGRREVDGLRGSVREEGAFLF